LPENVPEHSIELVIIARFHAREGNEEAGALIRAASYFVEAGDRAKVMARKSALSPIGATTQSARSPLDR
jgi:hypothetical protein